MKFKYIIFFIVLSSCTSTNISKYSKQSHNSKGFAYIYSFSDYQERITNKKVDTNKLIISNNQIRRGALIKITNPRNGKNIIIKNSLNAKFPEFYKILITPMVSKEIQLDENFPYVEVEELRKNKSFIAKKAQMHEEEKQLHSSAPVEKVKINNLGKSTISKSQKKPEFIIILGNFYSLDSAKLLKKRIQSESDVLKNKKISILKKNKHNFEVFLGPYKTIKKIKNDYIALKQINFDEVDVKIYE